MKTTNVITHALMVPFGSDGSLEIIGHKDDRFGQPSTVVFMAKGNMVTFVFHSQPDFCKNCITTWSLTGGNAILIFEYSLRDKLRNPQKLLKSVRNKLAQVYYLRQQEWQEQQEDAEMQRQYLHPSRAERDRVNRRNGLEHPTDMFEEDQGDRSEPLPQVFYT